MITISIHGISLFIGFLLGSILIGIVNVVTLYDKRWDLGFSDGWKARGEYKKDEQREDGGT